MKPVICVFSFFLISKYSESCETRGYVSPTRAISNEVLDTWYDTLLRLLTQLLIVVTMNSHVRVRKIGEIHHFRKETKLTTLQR